MRGRSVKGAMSANTMLGVGLAGCVVLVVIALVAMKSLQKPPPPPRPRGAAATAAPDPSTAGKYSAGDYMATLEEDAKAVKLPTPKIEQMAAPLPFFDELPAGKTLKADRDQIDTPHLHLATKVVKEWSTTGSAQQMRIEHIMMTITNKTERPLAYRVETGVGDGKRCRSKGVLTQNAIALRPNETVTRSECFWFKNATVDVKAIQVVELTDLGYYYVSRLTPGQILLDERTTAGHEVPGKLKACAFVPWREIKTSSETTGGVSWADVIDFYARHNCDDWTFFTSYRRWTAPGALPAHPGEAAAALEPSAKSR